MKSKKLKIGLLLTLIVVLLTGVCFAENETEIEPIDETESTPEDVTPDYSSIISDDLYSFATDVTINQLVDGNIYAFGQTVTVDTQVAGNLFVFANSIIFTENAYVQGSCYALANDIIVHGVVYDLYSLSSNLTISTTGIVYRDMRVGAENVDLQGRVGRNAFIGADTFTINTEADTRVFGNLEYTCKNDVTIDEKLVEGTISRKDYVENIPTIAETVSSYVTSGISGLLFTAVLFLLMIWLTPKAIVNLKETLKTKLPASIGLGALTLLIVPLIAILAIMSEYTIGIGAAILTVYILLICISTAILSISIAKCISEKFHIEKTILVFLVTLGVSLVLWGLKQIPVLGGYISLLVAVVGVGIIIRNLVPSKKKQAEVVEGKE